MPGSLARQGKARQGKARQGKARQGTHSRQQALASAAIRPPGESARHAVVQGTTTERDFIPSRKHSQEHLSTDSTARKRNGDRDRSRTDCPSSLTSFHWGRLTSSCRFTNFIQRCVDVGSSRIRQAPDRQREARAGSETELFSDCCGHSNASMCGEQLPDRL